MYVNLNTNTNYIVELACQLDERMHILVEELTNCVPIELSRSDIYMRIVRRGLFDILVDVDSQGSRSRTRNA